ncbi:hypothetical protein PybrP1_000427, partial [[Pythium] brassicae (nom. inval.)]
AASSASFGSALAVWKRRAQALFEVEGVWEVVTEHVAFDEAWPLAKQLEFIAKDKRAMHLILATVHDALALQLGDCDRSWLMLQRLESVFAAHRVAVRAARRAFVDLRFDERVSDHADSAASDSDADGGAMQRFVDRVRRKAHALARLRGGAATGDEDEMVCQLLDALPASWAPFVAGECEVAGDLTWASLTDKVLLEYSRRRAESSRRRVRGAAGPASTSSSAAPLAVAPGSSAADADNGSQLEQGQDKGDDDEDERVDDEEDADGSATASPALAGKAEGDAYPPYDGLSDNVVASSAMTDYADPSQQATPHLPYAPHTYHQQQQQQQQLDPYYEPSAGQGHAPPAFARTRRDRDAPFPPRSMPYSRPPAASAQHKICYYCALPGHTAHLCPLKRLHQEERKKSQPHRGPHPHQQQY